MSVPEQRPPSASGAGRPDAPPATPPPPVPPPGAPGPGGERAGGPAAERQPARPHLDDRTRSLDPRIVQVWTAMAAVAVLVPLLPVAALAPVLLGRWGWAITAVLVVAAGLWVRWYPRARFDRWRWQLNELALDLRHGLFVHRHEAVPYFRIQQIDVAQGPLDRLLGLATLQVTTASASGSAALPGISADEAPQVRIELLARAAEAVGEHPGELRDAV